MSELKSIVFFETSDKGLEPLVVLAKPLPVVGSQITINSIVYDILDVVLSSESQILEIYHVHLKRSE